NLFYSIFQHFGRSGRPAAPPGPGTPRRPLVDVASASNFSCFTLRHFHLDLRVNFAMKEMSGWLVLDLVPVQPGVQTLILDSHPSLLIHAIDCKVPGAGQQAPLSLTYRVDPFTDYGSSLNISLPAAATTPGQLIHVTVRYTTTDGPAVRHTTSHTTPYRGYRGTGYYGYTVQIVGLCTYTATVRVPDGVTVLMSASRSSFSKLDRVFQFSMEFPVPSYLVALVAGELQHVDVGPRCDINPCLTFIIASILESSEFLLIDVVHEIAHGWFGNAVTNATWEEMWLSEGLATYAQRRITTEAYGKSQSQRSASPPRPTVRANHSERVSPGHGEAYGRSVLSPGHGEAYGRSVLSPGHGEAYGRSVFEPGPWRGLRRSVLSPGHARPTESVLSPGHGEATVVERVEPGPWRGLR
uniref:Arginyl aminopeptidase like 1 n=1 Tax=Sander lucioperca TaxID=283035 RepID=A0A8C9XBL9_SANLU